LKRLFVESATAFVVPGSAAAAYLQGLGVLEERIAVAPNATSLSALPEGQSLERGGRVVLFVGRLAPEKGLDILLEAARDLPVDVRVVGEGPDGARLRGSAPPNATFLGQLGQDALAQQYAEADVFVLPSLSEPWGMVLNEAAGAGLPLVATDACGAAYDLIEDGVNGFRIPAGDAGALREAVRRLVDDAALRDHAGRRSREIATRFTPDAWAAAVAALARRLAA
jgi:glycosyltransferase involved in cell wall biosynthesis